jgi:hypothetical protein
MQTDEGRLLAQPGDHASGRIGEVVVEGRARRMVDRIAAAARRATFEAEELARGVISLRADSSSASGRSFLSLTPGRCPFSSTKTTPASFKAATTASEEPARARMDAL